MGKTLTTDRVTIPCRVAMVGAGLKTITLIPDGLVVSTNGAFTVDERGAGELIAAFTAHGTPLVIDFEHQTLGGQYAAPDGLARAAGWVHKLWYERGRGVLALVEWNDKARDAIRAKEYRFISPVVLVRKSDRRAVALHSAGLTNKPAIPRMEALAAAQSKPNGDKTMKATIVEFLRAELPDLDAEKLDNIAERLAALLHEEETEEAPMTEMLSLDAVTLSARVAELEREAAQRDLDAKLETFIGASAFKPGDEVYESVAHFAAQDWDRAVPILDALKRRFVPPQGRTVPPKSDQTGSRYAIIASAKREFEGDAAHARITTGKAFISMRLREKGMAPLTSDEATELAIG